MNNPDTNVRMDVNMTITAPEDRIYEICQKLYEIITNKTSGDLTVNFNPIKPNPTATSNETSADTANAGQTSERNNDLNDSPYSTSSYLANIQKLIDMKKRNINVNENGKFVDCIYEAMSLLEREYSKNRA